MFWTPSYFGATEVMAAVAGSATPATPNPTPLAPANPRFVPLWDGADVTSNWQVLAWAHDLIAGSGLIEPDNVAVGRYYVDVANGPRVWLIPVSYMDRPDSAEMATRTVIYAANLAVPMPSGETSDLECYQELARFEELIIGLLEPGPPGSNPTMGGLQKAVYDSPPGQKQDSVTPLQPMLSVGLLFAVAFDRELPVAGG